LTQRENAPMSDHAEAGPEPSVPILTQGGGRALLSLHRPRQHNRLEPADLAVLRQAFERIDADPAVRVLILTAAGPSFSSGFHIGALARERGEEGERHAFEEIVNRLEALWVPAIAALNGSIYGGAIDLALACDFRIGVAGMRLLMPAARLGIVYYESGLSRYVTRLGLAAAKKLFLCAEPIDADEMLRIGFLDEVVNEGELMARAEALAATLAAGAPLALAPLKRALNEIAAGRLDRAALAAARERCARSADHAEALKAWAERRKPVFTGR
jgi:enoyl-CoA hydratase/carnithine racemase